MKMSVLFSFLGQYRILLIYSSIYVIIYTDEGFTYIFVGGYIGSNSSQNTFNNEGEAKTLLSNLLKTDFNSIQKKFDANATVVSSGTPQDIVFSSWKMALTDSEFSSVSDAEDFLAKYKEKYLAQAYETNGIILVSEYVSVMDKEEFLENQLAISKILDRLEVEFDEKRGKIGKKFILGDMGMSEKNYGNWGKRMNGEIVVLDYGYLYELQIDEWKEVAKCPICGSSLGYKEDYSELVCEKEDCKAKVQYTTLRNNFGYANIVKNIIKNINIDKYVKFDENGKIVVDVMDIIEIEEEEKEEYKLPEEVVDKINLTMEKFFEMAECIKRDGELNVFCQRKVKDDLFDEKDIYDEILFPCLIAAINLTDKNIEKYLKVLL